MKILALVTDAFGGFGGIAQYNRDLLNALSSIENISEIKILPRSNTHEQRLGNKMQQYPGIPAAWRYIIKALQLRFAMKKCDVIFCGHLYMLPLAVMLGKVSNTPVWLQIHGIDAWDKPKPLLRWAVRQVAWVTAVSRYTKKRFLQWAAILPERVKVLPNTLQAQFQPGQKPSFLQQRYDITDEKILLTVGRLAAQEAYKGQDRVIAVLPKLLLTYPKLRYLIAGSGDDEARLKALTKSLNLEAHVRFLGKVNDTELADHYRLADVYVMPSSKEGFGIVFLEAAACGLPVIAGNMDGSPDALLDGRLGVLINPLDETALCEAILNLLSKNSINYNNIEIFYYQNFVQHTTALFQHMTNSYAAST